MRPEFKHHEKSVQQTVGMELKNTHGDVLREGCSQPVSAPVGCVLYPELTAVVVV